MIVPHRMDALIAAKLLLTLHHQIGELEQQIAQVVAAHPDAFIFEGLPGAGPTLAPRLLAAFGSDRENFLAQGPCNSLEPPALIRTPHLKDAGGSEH